MNALKDVKIISLILIIAIGVGFESLKRFQIKNHTQDEIGKAGEIFSIYRESTLPLKNKALRQPKAKIQKISAQGRGIKFDLKAAISNYQKEHGLEEHDFGAKQRPDKLKKGDNKKKKKKASKYEYVFDKKTGRWIKRRKLTKEQKEQLLAKKEAERLQAEWLEKMKEQQEEDEEKNDGPDFDPDPHPVVQNQEELAPESSEKEEENQRSYEDWAKLLLQHPDAEVLQEFLKAYIDGSVSPDIFHRITSDLVTDPRIEMKKQGLFLVDHSAPSPRSFENAVQIILTDMGELRTKAHKILSEDYATLKGLTHLQKVLKIKNDPATLIIATQKLEEAIEKYLKPAGGTSYTSNFTPFISLLTELTELRSSTEEALQAVASQATRTLALLPSQTVAALEENF